MDLARIQSVQLGQQVSPPLNIGINKKLSKSAFRWCYYFFNFFKKSTCIGFLKTVRHGKLTYLLTS